MTRKELADRAADELCGMLLDAITAGRAGADAFMWLRIAAKKVRDHVNRLVEGLPPEVKPPVNGQAAKPQTEVRK